MSGLTFNPIGTRLSRLAAAAIILATVIFGYVHAQRTTADPHSVGAAEAEALIVRANLAGRMEAGLGDSFGGVWFDPSTGQMHVGVTSPADRQVAEEIAARSGLSELVTETPVDSTWNQLTAAQQALNRDLDDLFARGQVRTSALPDTNSITVELASTVAASRRAALQRDIPGTGVDVAVTVASAPSLIATAQARCKKFEKEKAHCDKPIVAGVRIDAKNGASCTAGPAIILQDLSTEANATSTYILTAGHCISEGGAGAEWFAFNKAEEKKLIGNAVEGLRGVKGLVDKVDVGVIKVNKPGEWVHENETPVTPGIAEWSAAAEVEPTPVTAQAALPAKGTEVCVSGQIAGKSCGTLFAPSVTQTFENTAKEKWTAETLAEVEGATTGGGTSGGPWYLKTKPGEALGTHVGAGTVEEGGKKFERKWFQPLATSFENLATKYQLLTTTNEKRKHPGAGPPFTSSAYPAVITGSSAKGSEVLKLEAGNVECSGHLEGTLPGITTTLALKPTYTECAAFGFLSATMSAEGCTYELHSTEKVEANVRRSHVDVVCPAGQSIKIVASTCKAEIKAQTGLTTAKTTNEGEKIKLTWELGGIAYTVTQDGIGCPFAGTGSKTGGQYTGSVTLSRVGGGSIDVGE